jgi:hypothetical protein
MPTLCGKLGVFGLRHSFWCMLASNRLMVLALTCSTAS